MSLRPSLAIILGAMVTVCLGLVAAQGPNADLISELESNTVRAIEQTDANGLSASFTSPNGFLSRHPVLSGGEGLDEATRDRVAKAVAAISGVGGVRWSDGTIRAEIGEMTFTPLHCQEDVEALLRARTIRFEESSSRIDATSLELLDEVAMALRPCLGSIIAITGHTDASGTESANLALSQERASAVRQALIARGIPSDGLRAEGVGSSEPAEGLAPQDPANRRIEFSVIATVPVNPTPVDTPGAR